MGALYIARSSKMPGLKIGYSMVPAERMKTIELPSGGMAMAQLIFEHRSEHARAAERHAHFFLRARKIKGEWFDVSRQEAMWAIWAAIKDQERLEVRAAVYVRQGPPQALALDRHSVVARRYYLKRRAKRLGRTGDAANELRAIALELGLLRRQKHDHQI